MYPPRCKHLLNTTQISKNVITKYNFEILSTSKAEKVVWNNQHCNVLDVVNLSFKRELQEKQNIEMLARHFAPGKKYSSY